MDQAGKSLSEAEKEYNEKDVNFFTPVSSDLYQEIMDNLRKNNVPVVFKLANAHAKSNFVPVEDAELGIIRKFDSDLVDTPIMCSFTYSNNKYFFKSKATSTDVYFFLNFPEKIYKIQRRNNFRLSVPNFLDHKINIIEFPSLESRLIDISLGGCRLEISTQNELELIDETDITIEINILHSEIKDLVATIVFNQFSPELQKQTVGLQFGQISADQTAHLHTTLIQVDRAVRHREI